MPYAKVGEIMLKMVSNVYSEISELKDIEPVKIPSLRINRIHYFRYY